MIAQRVGVSALRRGAARPAMFTQNVAKVALSTSTSRPVATEKLSSAQEDNLLASQRLNRPLSPHMQIYDPAQTFFTPSIWTRITGGALSGALYAYSGLYLISPLVGYHIESSALVAAFAAMPFAVKGVIKTAIAWPFVFHLLNGVRHFAYDAVYGFSKPQIKLWAKIIGWASGAIAVGLGFLY